jgi:hypothetical protein
LGLKKDAFGPRSGELVDNLLRIAQLRFCFLCLGAKYKRDSKLSSFSLGFGLIARPRVLRGPTGVPEISCFPRILRARFASAGSDFVADKASRFLVYLRFLEPLAPTHVAVHIPGFAWHGGA